MKVSCPPELLKSTYTNCSVLAPWAWQVDPAKSSEFDELIGVGIKEAWIRSVLQSLQETAAEKRLRARTGAWGSGGSAAPDVPELIADAAEVNARGVAGYLRSRVEHP